MVSFKLYVMDICASLIKLSKFKVISQKGRVVSDI